MTQPSTDYPELEGTMNLCEDMIEAPATERVPAPDELQEELRRVRVVKDAHVRAQRYALAAVYAEVEKQLQSYTTNQNINETADKSSMTLYDGLTMGFANTDLSDEQIEDLLKQRWGLSKELIDACKWYRQNNSKQTQ